MTLLGNHYWSLLFWARGFFTLFLEQPVLVCIVLPMVQYYKQLLASLLLSPGWKFFLPVSSFNRTHHLGQVTLSFWASLGSFIRKWEWYSIYVTGVLVRQKEVIRVHHWAQRWHETIVFGKHREKHFTRIIPFILYNVLWRDYYVTLFSRPGNSVSRRISLLTKIT